MSVVGGAAMAGGADGASNPNPWLEPARAERGQKMRGKKARKQAPILDVQVSHGPWPNLPRDARMRPQGGCLHPSLHNPFGFLHRLPL
jgi:hypothetical protein